MIQYTPADPCCGVRPTFCLLDENMVSHFSACKGGTPEAPLIDWAWSIVGKPGGLFVDIGAHVGSWALPFACAGMEVVAFEPNSTIYSLLASAADLNDCFMWTNPWAVSDRSGVARLTAPGVDGGMGSIVCQFGYTPVDEQVDTVILDGFAFNPDVIKIDVEGAELDVLRGARETIDQHKPVIFFECWADERGQRIRELFAYVTEMGYVAYKTSWDEMYLAVPC